MSEFPFGYEKIAPITWAYLSSLLMFGLFFKFNRVWSVRNFDLVLLVLLAPGLLMVHYGSAQRQKLPKIESPTQQTPPTSTLEGPDLSPLQTKKVLSVGHLSQTGDRQTAPQLEGNDPKTDSASSPEGLAPEPSSGTPSGDPQPGNTDPSADTDSAPNSDDNDASTDVVDEATRLETIRASLVLERRGYLWLFMVALLFMIRMFADPMMVRRPLLEPNLSSGGLTFIGCSLLIFLVANVMTGKSTADDLYGPESAEQLIERQASNEDDKHLSRHGPGYALLHVLPIITTFVDDRGGLVGQDQSPSEKTTRYSAVAKTTAILGQLAIVLGIVLIGARHFGNFHMGVGIAALYLMLPYTAQMSGRVTHVLPAALMVWALVCYRRPLAAGTFIGLAMGVVYYPIFLLPLWVSFYWRRGLLRFAIGVVAMIGVLGICLAFVSTDFQNYVDHLRSMFGVWSPKKEGLQGIWSLGWDSVYRLPILAGFVVISFTFAVWPAQKNLGTLLSCSCALMVAVQFWHGYGGGLYMAWYLPTALLTIFRPNLEDRVALSVLDEGWLATRRLRSMVNARSAA